MSDLPRELRELIDSGPLAHLSTINADGSSQVTVIWIGLDGDELVSGHMARRLKVRNMERDPRVVLSFDAPRVPGVFLAEYAVIRARAVVQSCSRAAERRRVGSSQPPGEGLRIPDDRVSATEGSRVHRALQRRRPWWRWPLGISRRLSSGPSGPSGPAPLAPLAPTYPSTGASNS